MEVEAWLNNLPEPLTSFVGRSREREEVREALATTRLLVLTGPGGVGKTRLAGQVAGDCAGMFPAGAWWVELAPVADGALVGSALAGVLGVRPLPGRTAVQAAVQRLSDAKALVLLDNCEHLLEAAADVVEALLRGCPGVRVLATSRAPLGVPGEALWPVPSLSLPGLADGASGDMVLGSDSGRLFVERAVKASPRFAVAGRSASSVAQICRELEGIPLAIELAAVRVRMLSVEQIAAALRDRLSLLTGGPRGVMARQQTLRASVDWSYELLSEAERVLFRRLAVFVGGWSLEAAEAVGGGDGAAAGAVLDQLSALVDQSLVLVEDHGRDVRYRMLETVRQYALELLTASGEDGVVRDRHLGFFLALAERAAALSVSASVSDWVDLLESDAANFESAIDHGVGSSPERALRVGVALTGWWTVGGHFAWGQSALERALDAADGSDTSLRARALWSCGHLARYRADHAATAQCAQEALSVAEAVGDEATMARALHTLGTLRSFQDPVGSRPGFTRSIELARRSNDEWAQMASIRTLAWSYVLTDDYAEAEKTFDSARQLIEKIGAEGVTWAALGRAWCAMQRGEHARCVEEAERTVAAARCLGDPLTEAFAHAVVARIETAQGRPQAALERALASEGRVIASGAAMALPITRTEIARAELARGNLDRAEEVLAAVVAGRADSGWFYCQAVLALGEARRLLGDPEGALDRACEGLEMSERLGFWSLAAAARELLAWLAIERSAWSEAERLLHEALARRVELGARVWLPQTLEALAQVAAGLESYSEAGRLLGAAERARADIGLVLWRGDAGALERLPETLGQRLGEDGYAASHAEGAKLTLDEAVGWIRRARGTRKRPGGGWQSLTPTESQVVVLVSQGLTNPQVAERMFVSRATVKTHLTHVFQKLGVRSRTELAALAARQAD